MQGQGQLGANLRAFIRVGADHRRFPFAKAFFRRDPVLSVPLNPSPRSARYTQSTGEL